MICLHLLLTEALAYTFEHKETGELNLKCNNLTAYRFMIALLTIDDGSTALGNG
jgi:hypothetical protein